MHLRYQKQHFLRLVLLQACPVCCACCAHTYVHVWCMCTAHYNSTSAPQTLRTRYLEWKQSELADALSSTVTATPHISLLHGAPQSPYKDHYHCCSKHIHASILKSKSSQAQYWTWALGPGMPTYTAQVSRQMSSFIVSPWRKKKMIGRSACDSISITQTPTAMAAEDMCPQSVLTPTTTGTLVKTGCCAFSTL